MTKHSFVCILVILIASMSLSSCITIINKVKVNADKSGTAFIGVEINMFSKLKTLSSDNISAKEKNTIISFPEIAKQKLSGLKGISNIKTYGIVNFGRFGVEFDFKNSKALNKAYYKLMDEDYRWFYPSLIKVKSSMIKVKNLSPYIKSYIEDNEDDLLSPNIIKYVDVATIIELPRQIKYARIGKGAISHNEKIFTNITPLKSIMNEEVSIGFRLKY